MHRTLNSYLDTLDDTDTVGREYVAEAIYVARRDDPIDEPSPDDLRPILANLPEQLSAADARRRLAACLLRRAADTWEAAEFFKESRTAIGDSQRQWADRFDMPQQTVSKYERGDRNFGKQMREKMQRIADGLGPKK